MFVFINEETSQHEGKFGELLKWDLVITEQMVKSLKVGLKV